MGDSTILELVRQTASHGAEITELSRRIGILEGHAWWMLALLVTTLSTSLAGLVFSRKAANGRKASV